MLVFAIFDLDLSFCIPATAENRACKMNVSLVLLVCVVVFLVVVLAIKAYVKLTCGTYTILENLSGRIIMITGASAGIGKEAALELARHGARLYLVVRNLEKGETVVDLIKRTTGNSQVFLLKCDFSSLDSVRKCAAEYLAREKRLHVLINNAGMCGPGAHPEPKFTIDKLEEVMQSNHFGPFLLTNLLLGVVANCVHPGLVWTDIFALKRATFINRWKWRLLSIFAKTQREGCFTTVYCAVAPELEHVSGCYFADCKPAWSSEKSNDNKLAADLWEISSRLTGLSGN